MMANVNLLAGRRGGVTGVDYNLDQSSAPRASVLTKKMIDSVAIMMAGTFHEAQLIAQKMSKKRDYDDAVHAKKEKEREIT